MNLKHCEKQWKEEIKVLMKLFVLNFRIDFINTFLKEKTLLVFLQNNVMCGDKNEKRCG